MRVSLIAIASLSATLVACDLPSDNPPPEAVCAADADCELAAFAACTSTADCDVFQLCAAGFQGDGFCAPTAGAGGTCEDTGLVTVSVQEVGADTTGDVCLTGTATCDADGQCAGTEGEGEGAEGEGAEGEGAEGEGAEGEGEGEGACGSITELGANCTADADCDCGLACVDDGGGNTFCLSACTDSSECVGAAPACDGSHCVPCQSVADCVCGACALATFPPTCVAGGDCTSDADCTGTCGPPDADNACFCQ